MIKRAFWDGTLEDFPTVLEMRMLVHQIGFMRDDKRMQQLMVLYHNVLLPKVAGFTQWGPKNRRNHVISAALPAYKQDVRIHPTDEAFVM